MQKLKSDYLDETRHGQARVSRGSETSSRGPIKVPLAVRWREFRIGILPPLAFAGVLVLAGVMWQKAVVPVAMRPAADPLPGFSLTQDRDPAVVNTAMGQTLAGDTNVMARPAGATSP